MKGKIWTVVALVLAASLVAGGLSWTGIVLAEEQQPPSRLRGQILEVGSESLTIKTPDGEVEIAITDQTEVRVPGLKEASLADLSTGIFVVVETEGQAPDDLVARTILARLPRPLLSYVLKGTVTAVSADQIRVETGQEQSATLLIDDGTRLWVPGEPPTSTITLEAGDPVLALGTPRQAEGEERTLAARIVVLVSDQDLALVTVQGTAVAITHQIIVVDGRRGERAITVRPRTRIWSAAGRVSSLADIRPGTHVLALGQPNDRGQWFAGVVFLLGPHPLARHSLGGEVLSVDIEAGTLQLRTERRGEITLLTNEKTRYRIPETSEPGLADIQVGDRVKAVGHFQKGSQSEYVALGIGVIVPPEEPPSP